jgi:hypothetical protein
MITHHDSPRSCTSSGIGNALYRASFAAVASSIPIVLYSKFREIAHKGTVESWIEGLRSMIGRARTI